MRIAIGSDRAGSSYRGLVARHLESLGHTVTDFGTMTDEPVDYPDYAALVARDVLDGAADRGILVCGSGIGMAMTANRFTGIRAANCGTVQMAELAREHNDANVLCLGERLLEETVIPGIIDAFLDTEASEVDRHRRRVDKIDTAARSTTA